MATAAAGSSIVGKIHQVIGAVVDVVCAEKIFVPGEFTRHGPHIGIS